LSGNDKDDPKKEDLQDSLPDFLADLDLPEGLTVMAEDIGMQTVGPTEEEESAPPPADDTDAVPDDLPEGSGGEDDAGDDSGLYTAHFPRLEPVGDPDQLQRMVVRIEEGFKQGDRLELFDMALNEIDGRLVAGDTAIAVDGGGFDESTRSLVLSGLASPEDYDFVVSHIALSSIEEATTTGKRILRITATDGTGANWDAPLLILDVE
jgi:hypothetical protein